MTSKAPSTPADVASHPSPYPFDETLRRLEQVVRARGLAVFAHFDHSGEAAKVGLTMQPTHVLVFGSPKAGTRLMIAEPVMALELPLKTLVWQDHAGQVWVCYAEPAALARRYALPPDLVRVVAAVEGIVAAALHDVPAP